MQKVIHLTEQATKTYLHLGIIISSDKLRHFIYEKKKEAIEKEGGLPINLDLAVWYASVFPKEELDGMWEFRGRLVHGSCIVNPDGVLTIFDPHDKKHHVYSAEDVRQMALLFWGSRFENRVSVTLHTPC